MPRHQRLYVAGYLVLPHILVVICVVGTTTAIFYGLPGTKLAWPHAVLGVAQWAIYRATVCRLPALATVGQLGRVTGRKRPSYAPLLTLATFAAAFLIAGALAASAKKVVATDTLIQAAAVDSSELAFISKPGALSADFLYTEKRGARYTRRKRMVPTLYIYASAHADGAQSRCIAVVASAHSDLSLEESDFTDTRAAVTRQAREKLRSFERTGGYLARIDSEHDLPIHETGCEHALIVRENPRGSVVLSFFFATVFMVISLLMPIVALFKQPNSSAVLEMLQEPSMIKRLFFQKHRWA